MLIVGQNVLNVLCSGEGTSIFAQLKCFPAVIGQYLCVGFIMLVIKVSFWVWTILLSGFWSFINSVTCSVPLKYHLLLTSDLYLTHRLDADSRRIHLHIFPQLLLASLWTWCGADVIYSERGHAASLRCHNNDVLMITVIFKKWGIHKLKMHVSWITVLIVSVCQALLHFDFVNFW